MSSLEIDDRAFYSGPSATDHRERHPKRKGQVGAGKSAHDDPEPHSEDATVARDRPKPN